MMDTLANSNSYILRSYYRMSVAASAYIYSDKPGRRGAKALFGFKTLKFNSHHINVAVNTWSTKCRLIACMSAQIKSNLRDKSIKSN
jgi:hypothetical protein